VALCVDRLVTRKCDNYYHSSTTKKTENVFVWRKDEEKMKHERLLNVIWLVVYQEMCSWREQKELKLTSRLFKDKPLNVKAVALNFKPGLCTLPRTNFFFVEKISLRTINVDLTAYLSSLDQECPNLQSLSLFGVVARDMEELAELFARPQCFSRLTSLYLDSRDDLYFGLRLVFNAIRSKKIKLNTTSLRQDQVDSSFFGPEYFVTG
jgi:hypothetical protein